MKNKKVFERVSYPVRYAVMIWFTGIVRYFTEHAIYRVLFSGTEEQNEKINLGMTETIMSLSLVGFGTTAEMERVSVVDYFDMQVKALKKMISDTRGGGASLPAMPVAFQVPENRIACNSMLYFYVCHTKTFAIYLLLPMP